MTIVLMLFYAAKIRNNPETSKKKHKKPPKRRASEGTFVVVVESEAEVELGIDEVVVVLVGIGDGAVVDAGIFEVELQALGEVVVDTNLIHGLRCAPVLCLAVGLVAGLGVELRLDDRHDAEGIPAVGLVAQRGVGTHALAVQILSTEGVLVLVVLGR